MYKSQVTICRKIDNQTILHETLYIVNLRDVSICGNIEQCDSVTALNKSYQM